VVVKKTFRYPNVFFYNRNAFFLQKKYLFLQPLMPQSFIPEHFYGKGYKSLRAQPEKNPNNTQYNKKDGNAYLFPPFFFRQPRGNG